MDGSDNGGVTTENILAVLGAKEMQIQMLLQQVAMLRQREAALVEQLQSHAAKPEDAGNAS